MMRIDMRIHANIREQVRAGLGALQVQARQVWDGVEDGRQGLREIFEPIPAGSLFAMTREEIDTIVKRKLGGVIFTAVRLAHSSGFDLLECLDLAIEEDEREANTKRARKETSDVDNAK